MEQATGLLMSEAKNPSRPDKPEKRTKEDLEDAIKFRIIQTHFWRLVTSRQRVFRKLAI